MATDKIIVIDDDPTGSQTVHGCLLLTRWDDDTLDAAMGDAAPLFFILSNTRALTAPEAARVTREISVAVRGALARAAGRGNAPASLVVSRSDSTLRGHFPLETDVIQEILGPFDALFLVPAFFEGGRITRYGTHYLRQDGELVPVHRTEFARDSVFAFHHSYLPDYVEEKTGGRIGASEVQVLSRADLRADLPARLQGLGGQACVVVDAEVPEDLAIFARAVREATAAGKRFLFRSAASLLTALADLPPQPVAAEAMGQYRRGDGPGVILVGSHVRKSSEQLAHLLQEPGVEGVEVAVDQTLGEARADHLEACREKIRGIVGRGLDPVIFTSREERRFADRSERLAFGEAVSAFLMELVQTLPENISFLISKGGITSNDTLSVGLGLATARVVGQILPGCSVLLCPDQHPRYPRLPVVIFPGNVGDATSLVRARRRLRGERA